MPVGVDPARRQSWPISESYLAIALTYHQLYLEQLELWHDWLEDTESRNAEKLVLFTLIRDTIKRRGAGGDWQDNSSLPTSYELLGMLHPSKYTAFRLEVEQKRQPVESAALELVDILASVELIAELDTLPYDEQLLYANTLADQLASSNVGLLFLRQSLNAPPQSPLPLFHAERLVNQPGSFVDTDVPVMRRASRVYADVMLKLAPALFADADYTKFANATLTLLAKYFPEDIVSALTVEERIDQARQYLRDNPDYLDAYGKPPAAALYVLFELVNIYRAARALKQDPTVRTTFGFLRAVASLTSGLSAVQKTFKLPAALKLGPRATIGLNSVTVIYDLTVGAIDAHQAWQDNDLSVAAGHALQGVGLASAAAASAWVPVGALFPLLALNPVGLGLLAVGALFVTLAGTALIVYTKDPPIERWFENNYFGVNWANVAVDNPPSDLRYGFKHIDGHPNVPRQVSEFLSMFYPLQLKADRGMQSQRSVTISMQPQLAYHESHVVVTRIHDGGDQGGVRRYTPIPLYAKPANFVQDSVTYYAPLNPRQDEKLSDWIRTFSPIELSQGTNPEFDPAGSYLEVEVTLPDKLQPALAGIVATHPEVMDGFPFVLRERVFIE
jgi:hypothetical protein